MIRIAGIVVIALFFSQSIKYLKPDYAVYAGLSASVLLLFAGLSEVDPVLRYFSELGELSGYSGYTGILAKAFGVAMISESVSDMCADLGEPGLGGKVQFVGKCEIMLLSLPVIKEIVEALGSRLR